MARETQPAAVSARPSAAAKGKQRLEHPSHFHTLEREHAFRHPSNSATGQPEVHRLIAPLLESFNALFEPADDAPHASTSKATGLLSVAVNSLDTVCVFDGVNDKNKGLGNKLEFKIDNVKVGRPRVSTAAVGVRDARIFPAEARERLITYGAKLTGDISWRLNGGAWQREPKDLGLLPVMVRSNRCHLRGLAPAQLVAHHEESEEWGGYFIINGNERLMRYLIVPRRNHVFALVRPSFGNRGVAYSEYGVQIRSVRSDQSALTNTLHYLDTGGMTLRFSYRKAEYMIPVVVVLRALSATSDEHIASHIAHGDHDNTFLTDRIQVLLRGGTSYKLYSQDACIDFLGERFRAVLSCPSDWTRRQVGLHLINRVILVHLDDWRDKFRLMCYMIRKLYSLVAGICCADNPDSPQHQEVLLPGFLFGNIVKEKLEDILGTIRASINGDLRRAPKSTDLHDAKYLRRIISRAGLDIGNKLQYFLATGNLVSPSGLDLQQAAGFTIIAEKINYYRYLAHFRCIHRGAFFAELKTTAVRKLLPEAWGFLCPVHTPDGSPCGLLNHLSHQCRIITQSIDTSSLPSELAALGMEPAAHELLVDGRDVLCVQLDGRVIGWATPKLAQSMAKTLRTRKTRGDPEIPLELEIGLVMPSKGGQYAGLYLFSGPARMIRPVHIFDRVDDQRRLVNRRLDLVGSFEQVYLDIACTDADIEPGLTTHIEVQPTHMLSVLANLTPFSDFNQSPRNMYQCQMGKQTMGTPSNVLQHRTDNKLYRLQCGQTPIVRPRLHEPYGFDHFPNGTNAVVAVLAYTGYDMEDAMIINKSVFERGFGHGSIYKSHIVDIKPKNGMRADCYFFVGKDVKDTDARRQLIDVDGLPFVGAEIKEGQPICAWFDVENGTTKWEKYKGEETCYIEEVRLIGSDTGHEPLTRVHIKLRIPRQPAIGDKFSSRHGQKGVCSQKYASIDLPFSESGMQPDIIINPHAFPSRMTIGMFVESLAGKAGALHGLAQDATPFNYSEDYTPADHFGHQLLASGYNYHGNEPMYSGVTGREFAADIYIGLVYYQRLRHMVGDKWQVRTIGPVDEVTHQPIKGRKRGGGIRFGEMERDALLAHGTSYLLQDRLMNCSDYSTAWVCRSCGSLISLGFDAADAASRIGWDNRPIYGDTGPNGEYCRVCRHDAPGEAMLDVGKAMSSDAAGDRKITEDSWREWKVLSDRGTIKRRQQMDVVALPFVFRYLLHELAAMGIKLSLTLSGASDRPSQLMMATG